MTQNDLQDVFEINAPDVVEGANCYAAALGIDAQTVRAISGHIITARQNYPRTADDELFLQRDGRLGAGELGKADAVFGAIERVKERHRLYGLVIPLQDELALAHMSDGLRPLADGEAPGPNERRVSMVAGSGGPRFSPHYYFEHNGQLLHKPGPTALQVAPAASAEECVAIDPFYRQVVGHFAVDPNAAKRVYDPRISGPLVQEQCRPAVLAILDSIIPGMHKLAGEHNLSDETKVALAQDIAGLEDVIGAFCTRHNIPRGDAANRPGARQKTAAVPPPPSV